MESSVEDLVAEKRSVGNSGNPALEALRGENEARTVRAGTELGTLWPLNTTVRGC